jgi:C4-dicarboxylate-specific signal transduction histidine kinase
MKLSLSGSSFPTVYTILMNLKLRDRSYFPDIMAGKKVVGSLVVSKSTGRRSAVIAIPLKQGGKVVGAVGASLFLDKLSDQIVSALSLRKDAVFFALAPNGLTTLHNKNDRHFLDPRELGSVWKKAIFRTSGLTQWKFAIAFSDVPGN